jgi:hypothetical protein
LREPNLGKTNPRVTLLILLAICFAPSLVDLFIFLTLTRLVVVINFVNFSFALLTPPLSDFHIYFVLVIFSQHIMFRLISSYMSNEHRYMKQIELERGHNINLYGTE